MSIDLEAEMRWSVWHLVSIYFLPELLLLRRNKGKEQRWVWGQRSGHDFHSGRCLKFFCFHSVESIVFFLQGMLSARICKSLNGIPLMKSVWVWMFAAVMICVCLTELTVCSRSGVFVLLLARVQVRRLYQQALQKLPLSAALWKDVNSLFTSDIHSTRFSFGCCPHQSSSLSISSVCSLRLLKEVKLTHWKK